MPKERSPFAEMRQYKVRIPDSSINGEPFQFTFCATSPEYAQGLAIELYEQIVGQKPSSEPIVERTKKN